MCTLVVAELWAPGASHRENGSTRQNSKDKDRVDTFVKISFSYWGIRLFPDTCNTINSTILRHIWWRGILNCQIADSGGFQTVDKLFTLADKVWPSSFDHAESLSLTFRRLMTVSPREPCGGYYRGMGLSWVIWVLYNQSDSCVCIPSTVGVGLCKRCPFSLILFVIFTVWTGSQGAVGVRGMSGLGTSELRKLLFADDVILQVDRWIGTASAEMPVLHRNIIQSFRFTGQSMLQPSPIKNEFADTCNRKEFRERSLEFRVEQLLLHHSSIQENGLINFKWKTFFTCWYLIKIKKGSLNLSCCHHSTISAAKKASDLWY